MGIYQYESEIIIFLGVDLPLDLPPGLPKLSEWESISMSLKSSFSRGIDLLLDLPPGLPKLSEWESISMNLKSSFSQGDRSST